MADELDGLLNRVEDPALRAELRGQIDRLRAKRTFGLVFESHLPERVRLPDHPIRPGALVVCRDEPKGPTYQVLRIDRGGGSPSAGPAACRRLAADRGGAGRRS